MKKAIIYARVSSVGNRQDTARQLRDLKAYASNNDLQVVGEYSEHISGATSADQREQLPRALDHAAREDAVLLVTELSRLGRSTWDTLDTINAANKRDIDIFMLSQGLHTLEDGKPSAMAAVYLSALAYGAEMERNYIKERLNSGRAAAIEKGTCRLGRPVGSNKSREAKIEQYGPVLSALRRGDSIRNVAARYGVGVATVCRLKKEFSIGV